MTILKLELGGRKGHEIARQNLYPKWNNYKKIKIDIGNTITPKLGYQGYNNKKNKHNVIKCSRQMKNKPKKDDGMKIVIEIGW